MSGRSDYSEPSPPSKASLLKWWKVFSKQSSSKEPRGGGARPQQGRPAGAVAPAPYQPPGRGLRGAQDGEGKVFGVSLEQSLKFAAVAISMVAPYVFQPPRPHSSARGPTAASRHRQS